MTTGSWPWLRRASRKSPCSATCRLSSWEITRSRSASAEARGIFPGGASSLALEAERVRAAQYPFATAGPGGERLLGRSRLQFGRPGEIPGRHGAQWRGHPHDFGVDRKRRQCGRTRPGQFLPPGGGQQCLFIQDSTITEDQQALDFVSGAVNWLLSREQLIGIAPKVPHTLIFSLDEKALGNLRWLILLIMPLVPAVLGLVVWWQRRT